MRWLQVVIPICSHIEEACTNRVQELGATAVYAHFLPDSTDLLLYGVFTLESDRTMIEQEINDYLSAQRDLDFEVPSGQISLQEIDEDEYLNDWKSFFNPIFFDQTLVIEPVWMYGSAAYGEAVLKIDPGMAFGTGHHFTTQYCLQWICEHKDEVNSLLDLGCGSGILSIAAALLGLKEVVAVEYDLSVVTSVQRNFQLNQVQGKINFIIADILKSPLRGRFEAVVANLHTSLLLEAREQLTSWLKPGGSLVLTGIGKPRSDEVLSAYRHLSLQAIKEDPQGEWVGLWYKM